MPKLLKDGVFPAPDPWIIVDGQEGHPEDPGNKILPLELYLRIDSDRRQQGDIGIRLENHCDLDELALPWAQIPIVALEFPAFTDGRAFSQARVLRDNLDFKGDIRATGEILVDQIYYLRRCGFNEILLADEEKEETVKACLRAFNENYQAASDDPQPLFRRRA